jgi:hypothetical protein
LDFATFGVSPNISKNFLRRFRFVRRSGELSRQCPDEITVSVNAIFNGGFVFFCNPLKLWSKTLFLELFESLKQSLLLTLKSSYQIRMRFINIFMPPTPSHA